MEGRVATDPTLHRPSGVVAPGETKKFYFPTIKMQDVPVSLHHDGTLAFVMKLQSKNKFIVIEKKYKISLDTKKNVGALASTEDVNPGVKRGHSPE